MLLPHQSLPPFSYFPTLHTQPPSFHPLHTIPQHNIRRSSCIIVLCARSEDDYHATLKALKSKGRTPRKSLGQHYMLNTAINDKLVETAEVRDGDVVLEIGPGTGSLTKVLLNAGATVIAIEKDPHMAALVKERFASFERFSEEYGAVG
ncbi:hypothetical protein IFM89_002564 [Coptis chinensis]|uniref:rRNA adenine N(6)-methyltransferase n=1 Tax=Coptis chinensis TaxID=261450 RepID=A0A835HI50_9MAGN|nr:hypothetical protein IFM89_002564 [Coptis chinensis]